VRHVLDASALLAGLKDEAGADWVGDHLDFSVVSSVNLAEVVSGLVRHGSTSAEARAAVRALSCTVVAADEALAIEAGLMRSVTDAAGLSLADRFCLALAKRLGAPAATTDLAWSRVAAAVGVEVRLIR